MFSEVAFLVKSEIWKQKSLFLAKAFQLKVVFKAEPGYKAFLFLDKEGLLDVCLPAWGSYQALGLEFSLKRQDQVRGRGWSLKSLLPRALGLDKKKYTVLDVTAGFCEDSFILSSLGIEVLSVEQSKIIFSLVKDAVSRVESGKIFSLVNQNSIEYMQNLVSLKQRPEVIYMDPMFEIVTRKALSNKSMQVLQVLESYSVDLKQKNLLLLEGALTCSTKRVVLKRHKKMPSLKKPSYILEGKLIRYDVYLV